MIPDILYLTYRSNLLVGGAHSRTEKALLENVRNTIRMVPNMTVKFWANADCKNAMHDLPYRLQNLLLHRWKRIDRGMIRADLCRGVALYKTGGWYLDVDVQVLQDFRMLQRRMDKQTMLTVVPAWMPDVSYFQAIMGVTDPFDKTIQRYLWLFAKHKTTFDDENTGTLLLHQASKQTSARVYELQERRGPIVLQNHSTRSSHRGYWCDNVVYDPKYEDLWFYSRVLDSRMC